MAPPSKSTQELLGTRAIVLGSTSGIGAATALELARAGADVIVHGRRSREAGERVAASIRTLGRRSEVIMADLSDNAALGTLVGSAWSVWSGLDAWVHFAGADTLTGPAAKLEFHEKLELLLSVDAAAAMRLCREVGARMRSAGSGAILTIGWDQAETGMEGDSGMLFAAAKGAVMAFTKSLALAMAPVVRVNCIAPGWIKTAWGEQASELWQDRVIRETPLARWGTPEDVARVARFLLSPDAAFLTGQIVRVNGGAVR